MTEKYYFAESYGQFRAYCQRKNIKVSDRYFIDTNSMERIMGSEFKRDQIVIVDDPHARFSFWESLMTRIRT